jgi:hypothetical protein
LKDLQAPLIGPEKRKKKAIRTARCLSAASFGPFRFFLSIAGKGQSSGSPLLWLLSSGEAEESDSPSGETGGTSNIGWYQFEAG